MTESSTTSGPYIAPLGSHRKVLVDGDLVFPPAKEDCTILDVYTEENILCCVFEWSGGRSSASRLHPACLMSAPSHSTAGPADDRTPRRQAPRRPVSAGEMRF
jgi:hypothetical protein